MVLQLLDLGNLRLNDVVEVDVLLPHLAFRLQQPAQLFLLYLNYLVQPFDVIVQVLVLQFEVHHLAVRNLRNFLFFAQLGLLELLLQLLVLLTGIFEVLFAEHEQLVVDVGLLGQLLHHLLGVCFAHLLHVQISFLLFFAVPFQDSI